jgi:hypothetical protein
VLTLTSRLALAAATLLLLAYDLTLYAVNLLRGRDPRAIVERRRHGRGFLDIHAGIKVLSAMQAIAQESGAKVFLVSGTLLGMHREGHLLAHDYDIDVGVFADDPKLKDFIAAMQQHPELKKSSATRISATECRLNPWLGAKKGDALLYKFYFASGQTGQQYGVDVFVHFRVGDYDVHGNFRSFWINRTMELEPRRYDNVTFLVPRDTVTYLRENYGDFEVEKRNFESSVDCPNATNIYGVRGVAWLTGRYAYFLATREPEKRRIIGRRLLDYLAYGLFLKGKPDWRINQYDPRKPDA